MLIVLSVAAVVLGIFIAAYAIASPNSVRLPRERRRPPVADGEGALAGAAEAATGLFGRLLHSRSDVLAYRLELSGLTLRPQDFAFLTAVVSLVLGVLTFVLGGGLLAFVAAGLAPLGAMILLNARIAGRRKAFADQLGGILQLMASSLRAGHSMLQALASVARDSEEPATTELARVVNETRVGRPIVPALEEVATRMESEDFLWVSQAIAINREVGGSLAEVLDGVSETIRERGQIRRQVAALSSEGRISAVVLMLLPVVVGGFLVVVNPGYLAPFVENPIGIGLLVFSGILFLVGGIWLRKTVEIKF